MKTGIRSQAPSNNKKLQLIFSTSTALLLVFGFLVEAQQPKNIPRIGLLASDSHAPTLEAFRQELRDFGYIEGQNIFIEWRFTEGKSDRFPGLAAELLRLKLDVIVAGASAAVPYLRQDTRTIPIVMAAYAGVLWQTASWLASQGREGTSLGRRRSLRI